MLELALVWFSMTLGGGKMTATSRRGKSRERGNIAIIFAVSMLPIVSIAGFAIDTADYLQRRSDLQSVLDATTLTAARALQSGKSISHVRYIAINSINSNRDGRNFVSSLNLNVVERSSGGVFDVTSKITFIYLPNILTIIGVTDFSTHLTSTASYGIDQNMEIVFLVDFSKEMWQIPGLPNLAQVASHCKLCYNRVDCPNCTTRKIDFVMKALEDAIILLRKITKFNVSISLIPVQDGVHLPDLLYYKVTARAPSNLRRLTHIAYDPDGNSDGNSWVGNYDQHHRPKRLIDPVYPDSQYSIKSLVLPHINRTVRPNLGTYTGSECLYASDPVFYPHRLDASGNCSGVNVEGICLYGYVTSSTYCAVEHMCVAGRRWDLTNRYPGNWYEDNVHYCVNPVIQPLLDIHSPQLDATMQSWKSSEIQGSANAEAGYLWAWNILSTDWQTEFDKHWRGLARIAPFSGLNSARKIVVVLMAHEYLEGVSQFMFDNNQVQNAVPPNPQAPRVLNRSDIIFGEDTATNNSITRSLLICDKMKRLGVEVYIGILKNNPNQNLIDTYSGPCATDSSYIFYSNDGQGFVNAIANIVSTIKPVRLEG